MANQSYPVIKKVAWRFFRAFLSAFLVTFTSFVVVFDGSDIIAVGLESGFKAFLVNLWAVVVYPALLASIIAGIQALGKAIREYYGDEEYKSLVHKLPV